ncbi:hypothetical protein [Aquimarina sp. I32.4]|uniref:hypothetical protein n=1 Tax=Aquimarina sp. I32.4 TaxID=2053903 RepID=UPI000CDEA494|nr:hypothetical protein [Aquimarina sp. I32.4]
MKNIFKSISLGSVILSLSLIISCGSDDDNSGIIQPEQPVNLQEAKLSAFPLFGITAIKTEIIDPEIVDNKETKHGQINITVAATTSLDAISAIITSDELNLSKFSIAPGNDTRLSYVDGKTNLYTINNATGDKEELLHYTVSITREPVIVPETLKITSFKFEKSKNPSLPNDIEISRTIEDPGLDKIYLFVPVGTDFTNLVPTITYDGSKAYYYQNSSQLPGNATQEYPAEGMSIDFKYPNTFTLEVKNKDNDQFKTTVVIVDVINPIKTEVSSFTVTDIQEGASVTHVITQWTNQGNHVLEYGNGDTQENQDPVTPSKVFIFNRAVPGVGLAPGDSANVSVIINARDYPAATYKTTAVFYPRIKYNAEIDDLLEPARLDVTAEIIK